ncbi:MAG: S8 family serine peptidase [Actinomycetota bacterium]|jgi:hypothetical protein
MRRQGRFVRFGVGAIVAVLGSTVPAVAKGPTSPSASERSSYIVQFRAEPLAGNGQRGRKLDVAHPATIEQRHRLDAIEERVLRAARLSDARLGYRYRTTVAGFSARLTATEVARVRQQPEVASVTADRIRTLPLRRPATATPGKQLHGAALARAAAAPAAPAAGLLLRSTPVPGVDLSGQPADYLDLPEGLWARLGGPDQAGEDIVIGVIDGGIYPEHPSFADQPVAADGSRNYIGPAYGPPPATWRGTCQEGEAWPATTCNNKLIGARFFLDGLGAANVADEEYLSPRDVDGHGTAMASIAAGNYGVDPSYQGNDLGVGVISGIAPRARIAHYKVFWATPAMDAGHAAESDLVAAIDAAVADGVDILNYSIGRPVGETLPISDQSTMLDPESQAMLRAVDAGVLPVLPAGNAGPEPETIDSPGHTPWALSTGASGLSITFAATATVSGGPDGPSLTVQGVSPTPALPPVPLIDGAAAAAPGTNPTAAARCGAGTLDPALVKGKAVLCQPEHFLVASAVLFELGAAGAIFYQDRRSLRDAYDVWLPSVILPDPADALAIRRLITSTPNPTAAITTGTLTPTATGDVVVNFSSRGPVLGSLSLLKPDLLAPGTDVIAAHTPEVPPGARALFEYAKPDRFRPLGGTSVSVPNTVGAAALLLSLRPDLDPAELKSALMTTAAPDILRDRLVPSVPATPLEIGAGRIDPNRAAEPGLVVTETTERFEDYVSGQVPARDPLRATVEATDLNLPSIAFDPLIGPRSTRRTFTSVDPQPGTWAVSFEGLAGIGATASPARFSIDPGQGRTVEFGFTPENPALGEYVHGAVVLTHEGDGRTVRLPVNVRPEEFEAPEQLNFGTVQSAGHAPLPVPTGYQGQLSALAYGLAAPEVRRDQTVGRDDIEDENLNRIARPGPGVTVFDLTVPSGAQVLAAEIGGAALADPFADLDLYVFHDDEGDGFRADDLLDASETGAQEASLLVSPPAGAYRLSVRGISANPVATFDLTTWLLDDASPDVLTDPAGAGLRIGGDPVPVTAGGTGTLDLEWAGLDRPGVYLGFVTFHDTPVPRPNDPIAEMVVAITRPE